MLNTLTLALTADLDAALRATLGDPNATCADVSAGGNCGLLNGTVAAFCRVSCLVFGEREDNHEIV